MTDAKTVPKPVASVPNTPTITADADRRRLIRRVADGPPRLLVSVVITFAIVARNHSPRSEAEVLGS